VASDNGLSSHIDLIQGSLRLSAVAALFCVQPETLTVFREYVKKNNLYSETDWITTSVLAKASYIAVEHSNAGEQVRGLDVLMKALDGI
jgi:hypothetical protein